MTRHPLNSIRVRVAITCSLATIILIWLVRSRYNESGEIDVNLDDVSFFNSTNTTKGHANLNEVELVVSSVSKTDTSWISENVPHYPANIYVADDPAAALTVAKNKGHESTVYLTYVFCHHSCGALSDRSR